MDMSKDPAMKGMDMNHSKMEGMEKDDIKQKQMDMPKDPAKEGMEMDHSKMEGMKRTTCKKKL
jgi:hypothetical protein